MQNPSIVLIIDDEPASREALDALLASEGYQLEFANNGVEGLKRALELKPDVILLDVMMPGIDGFEVCRLLRADPILAEVPIVLITALDDQASRISGIEVGADDFISKPFNKPELRSRLHTITRLNRYRHTQVEHARFAWLLEQAQDGYVILRTDGTFIYANAQARLYLGLSGGKQGLTGTFLDIALREFRPHPSNAWENWPEVTEFPRFLVRPETPTAQAFWLKVDQLPSNNDQTFGQLLKLSDWTETITTHHNIQKFQAVIEHKLRTPLAQMQLSLELLLERVIKHKLVDTINLAQISFDEARQLVKDINDIFEYIRAPVLARQGQGFKLINLRSRIDNLSADLGLVNVNIVIPPALLAKSVTLTQSAVDAVFLELLENSQKFHPQHLPKVEIVVSLLNEAMIRIRIQDDGITLSPKQLSSAWIPYIQAEKNFTGEAPGMGLGLPLISTLVWQAGGSGRIENRTGKGVVVELDLPLEENR